MKKRLLILFLVVIIVVLGIIYLIPKNSIDNSFLKEVQEGLESTLNSDDMLLAQQEDVNVTASIPIFMYHWVRDDTGGYEYPEVMVKATELRKQMEYLHNENYDVLFVSDIDKIQHYEKPVILTFDDGWYDVYAEAFPIAKELNMKFNMYIIIDLVGTPGYCNWEQLKEMHDSGLVEMGSHTLSHPYLSDLSVSEITKELVDSKAKLKEEFGIDVPVICYPSGKQNADVQKVAKENYKYGLLMDGGIFYYNNKKSNLYAIERIYCNRSMSLDTYASFCKQAGVEVN